MEAVKHMLSAGGNEEARKKAEKEKTNTDADVIQFSGCRDDQTSADAKIDGEERREEGREGSVVWFAQIFSFSPSLRPSLPFHRPTDGRRLLRPPELSPS